MFFSFFRSCFSWLPLPLYLITSTIFTIFACIILVEAIKLIISLFQILKDVFGGLIAKVVDFFV